MKIQVLGTGCPKCQKLAEQTEQAARETGADYTLEKVTDLNAILAAGVMRTPALLVDGEVKVSGRVPSAEELKIILNSRSVK